MRQKKIFLVKTCDKMSASREKKFNTVFGHQYPSGEDDLRLFTHIEHKHQHIFVEKSLKTHSVACQVGLYQPGF